MEKDETSGEISSGLEGGALLSRAVSGCQQYRPAPAPGLGSWAEAEPQGSGVALRDERHSVLQEGVSRG